MYQSDQKTPPFIRYWGGALVLILVFLAQTARATERGQLEQFLTVTGFDVALDSIALSAGNAPAMLGMAEQDFGADWARVSGQVFDTAKMRETAIDILSQTLDEDLLGQAMGFYGSDLGQRLVVAENASHMSAKKDATRQEGRALVAQLVADGSPRIAVFNRMLAAIEGDGAALHASQEVQIRFLMAAAAAGVIKLKMDEVDLRETLRRQATKFRRTMRASSLANSAMIYRDFSDADIAEYAQALEKEHMQTVYELMNAVQYEIMAQRFEILARRMAQMHPGQDI